MLSLRTTEYLHDSRKHLSPSSTGSGEPSELKAILCDRLDPDLGWTRAPGRVRSSLG